MAIFTFFLAFISWVEAANTNRGWIFRKSANGGLYEEGKNVPLEPMPYPDPPKDGELLVRVIASSVIPSYRLRCDPEHWAENNEYHPFDLNKPINIEVALEVVASKSAAYKPGDRMMGFYPLVEYQIIKADGSDTAFKSPPAKVDPKVPLEKYFSVLSFVGGLTAYHGVEYVEAGKVSTPCDKIVLVTSAASSVGQIAGQLYKNKGCKVIGSTSTKKKAQEVMELGGFDAVIAYKEEDFEKRLNELAPQGVDIDFEHVGGPMFDAVLRNIKQHGKVVLCGFMSDYNLKEGEKQGIKANMEIILKRITVQGMMVMDILPHFGEAVSAVSKMVLDGTLKSRDTTIYGFEKWGQALTMIMDSKNMGRLVIRTDPEPGSSKQEL